MSARAIESESTVRMPVVRETVAYESARRIRAAKVATAHHTAVARRIVDSALAVLDSIRDGREEG